MFVVLFVLSRRSDAAGVCVRKLRRDCVVFREVPYCILSMLCGGGTEREALGHFDMMDAR